MLSYPVRIIPCDGHNVLLTFPDVPEAAVCGTSEDDAFQRAQGVLEAVLATYVVEGRAIPAPSDICGAPVISTKRFSVVGLELN